MKKSEPKFDLRWKILKKLLVEIGANSQRIQLIEAFVALSSWRTHIDVFTLDISQQIYKNRIIKEEELRAGRNQDYSRIRKDTIVRIESCNKFQREKGIDLFFWERATWTRNQSTPHKIDLPIINMVLKIEEDFQNYPKPPYNKEINQACVSFAERLELYSSPNPITKKETRENNLAKLEKSMKSLNYSLVDCDTEEEYHQICKRISFLDSSLSRFRSQLSDLAETKNFGLPSISPLINTIRRDGRDHKIDINTDQEKEHKKKSSEEKQVYYPKMVSKPIQSAIYNTNPDIDLQKRQKMGADHLLTFIETGVEKFSIQKYHYTAKKNHPENESFLLIPSDALKFINYVPDFQKRGCNISIRPIPKKGIKYIQIEDIENKHIKYLWKYAFWIERTSKTFHVWIAMKDLSDKRASEIKKQLTSVFQGDMGSTGASKLAGTLNLKEEYLNSPPLITPIRRQPGKYISEQELLNLGWISPEKEEKQLSFCASKIHSSKVTFPKYAISQISAKTRSEADWIWSKTCFSWGIQIEFVKEKLKELSEKSKKLNSRYINYTVEKAYNLNPTWSK